MALVLLLGTIGCRQPVEVDLSHAFVRRSGPSADTIRVERADTLHVTLDLDVQSGRAAWVLRDPTGRAAWSGIATADDADATISIAHPDVGDWRFVVEPDSAIGVVGGRAVLK